MNKYGPKAKEQIEKEIKEHKEKGKFKSKKQAIAVGIDKARRKGAKVPKNKKS
jgi:hypothetical protein